MSNPSPSLPWVINAKHAQRLLEAGATVLDVRNWLWGLFGHVPGAAHVNWRRFAQPHAPYKGLLSRDIPAVTAQSQALGIDADNPVLVVGNSRQWGENGRIVWTLRSLGHRQVALVDGGQEALVAAGVPIALGLERPKSGNFQAEYVPTWEIKREELLQGLNASDWVIIDTRSDKEFQGATPYGEHRGGHLPGAKHCHFQRLLDKQGYLLPQAQLWEILTDLGIDQTRRVITYCTGGVRSAFFVAVLVSLGVENAQNYAGSTWEWSAEPAEIYPLV